MCTPIVHFQAIACSRSQTRRFGAGTVSEISELYGYTLPSFLRTQVSSVVYTRLNKLHSVDTENGRDIPSIQRSRISSKDENQEQIKERDGWVEIRLSTSTQSDEGEQNTVRN